MVGCKQARLIWHRQGDGKWQAKSDFSKRAINHEYPTATFVD